MAKLRLPLQTWLWLAAMACVAALVAGRVLAGGAFATDIKALLPHAERDVAVNAAISRAQAALEQRLVVIVGGAVSPEQAARGAKAVRARLMATGFIEAQADAPNGGFEALGKLYLDHRFGLISDEMRPLLMNEEKAGALERAVLRQYFGPGGAAASALIVRDPLLLLPGFLAERQAMVGGQNFDLVEGEPVARVGGERYAVLNLALTASPYALDVQSAVMPALQAAKTEVAALSPGMTVRSAGVLPHAAAGAATGEKEVSQLGLISLLGVGLLLVAPFRSGRPLVFGMVVIGSGALAGIAACLAVFGQIHLLTLVFAVSLVGTSIDFVLHLLAGRLRRQADWQAATAARTVRPGMTLALATTCIGYAGLAISGFPGLMQMAVFSIIGLSAALLTTLTAHPLFIRSGPTTGAAWLERMVKAWVGATTTPAASRMLLVAAGVIALLGLYGLGTIRGLDDVRQFQSLDPAVVAEEQAVRHILGNDMSGQFLVVTGRSPEEVLAREEAAADALAPAVGQGVLRGVLALSRFVPSPARQEEVIARLRQIANAPNGALESVAHRIGLQEGIIAKYRRELAEAKPLTLEAWMASPASGAYRMLWLGAVGNGGVYASIVPLRGVTDASRLLGISMPAGVSLVDPAADVSEIFASYRERAVLLIVASFAIVAVLFVVYYGWQAALRLMAGPCLAALGVIAALALAGEPFTLFHTMALLLVLGLGVDYGIFFQESHDGDWTTFAAVALSALTTLLAFGLLALSQTAALAAFGLTMAIGITLAFLVASFAGAVRQPVALPAPAPLEITHVE